MRLEEKLKILPAYIYEKLNDDYIFDQLFDMDFKEIKINIINDDEDYFEFEIDIYDYFSYETNIKIRYDKKENKFELNHYEDFYDDMQKLFVNMWYDKQKIEG
jgi:hypothetical protein